jgi:hypothetical protein
MGLWELRSLLQQCWLHNLYKRSSFVESRMDIGCFCISGLYRLRMVGYRLCVVIAGIDFCFIVRLLCYLFGRSIVEVNDG